MCKVCNGRPGCPVCSPEPNYMKCEACNGTGYIWDRYDIDENTVTEVAEEEFNNLPTEAEALEKGLRYCKGVKDVCMICNGIGEVEYEDDYNDYWED